MHSSNSLGINSAYLVAQDWGTALAFHLAARRPDFVRGLAFMEFIRPMPTWAGFHHTEVAEEQDHAEAARATFRKFRTPGEGEAMILEATHSSNGCCPVASFASSATTRWRLTVRRSRRRRAAGPFSRFPRELPIAGEPADVYADARIRACGAGCIVLPEAVVRRATPGALVAPEFAERFAATLNHCALVRLGPGLHFLQEDHPEAIGRSVAGWIAGIEAVRQQRAA